MKNDEIIRELIADIIDMSYEKGDKYVLDNLEESILKINNPNLSYNFARYIGGADIKAHAQVVLDSKNPEYNYNFARYIEGADIEAHAQVVLDSKDPEYNYRFAQDVKGADVEAHKLAAQGIDVDIQKYGLGKVKKLIKWLHDDNETKTEKKSE